MLFTLFILYVIMFNKYHFSFIYRCCFISCMCVHVYVYTFIDYFFMYFVLSLFIVYFLLSLVWFLSCVFVDFRCLIFILYEHVCRHKHVFCFAFTCQCLHVFCFVCIHHSWCKYAHMITCSGFWNSLRYGWNWSGSRWCLRTHILEGEVHTEMNVFLISMVCVYS